MPTRAVIGFLIACLVVAAADRSAEAMRVATGSYTGTGPFGRPIVGVGFRPDIVIVKGNFAAESVIKTSTMPGNLSKAMTSNAAASAAGIVSLDADGFTVGGAAEVNQLFVTYHYVAFEASAGELAVGSYLGDGNDDRSLTGVGFQPAYMIVLSEAADEALQRFPAEVGDASLTFGNDNEKANRIQAFEADGFQLGNDSRVNGSNGDTYHYAAWRMGSFTTGGSYSGNATDDRNILGVGFQPVYLVVKNGQAATSGAHRTVATAGDVTMNFTPGAHFNDGIQALLADGFQVGTDPKVNNAGSVYYWVGFQDSAALADLAVGVFVNDAFPNVGDTITLTIDLDNGGPGAASGVEVTDFVPAGLSYQSHVASQGTFVAPGGRWVVGVVAPGSGATLNITATVAPGSGASTITNTASVTASDAPDPNPGNDTDAVDVVVQAADVAVTVTADTLFALEGDTLNFTVSVTNGGPHTAMGVVVRDAIPALLSYVADLPSQGAYTAATGQWSIGTLAPSASATLSLAAFVETGAMGSAINNRAEIVGALQEDPSPANDADSVTVQVLTPLSLADEAGSLYPARAVAGQPNLGLRIAVDNPAGVGVTLGTTSTIVFSDSVNTYSAQLTNPTYVPPFAAGFTLTFAREAVPVLIETGRLYDLVLTLAGVTDEAWPHAQTIMTSGSNAILIEPTQVLLDAIVLGDRDAHPGDVGVELLSLELQNGYPAARTLDSLVVTNSSAGAGTQAELDGNASELSLYDDVDSSGKLSAPDVWLASAGFSGGRATFDVTGWVLPASGLRRLVVTAAVDSMSARDGDQLNAIVASATDVVFIEPTMVDDTITPLYPVDSYGDVTVDGMVAHQLSWVASSADTLTSGDLDVLLATIVVPQNGYASDVLNALEIQDLSGGLDPTDLDLLELYRDNGNGVFDAAFDTALGPLVFSGDRFEISGVGAAVGAGERFFLVADVALSPGDGDTFQPAIPINGVDVQSGNDGPVDTSLASARTFVFHTIEKVDVTSRALASSTPRPGGRNVPLLSIEVKNLTPASVVLDSLALTNASSGLGFVAEMDAAIADVRLYAEDGNGVVDPWDTVLAAGLRFAGGMLTTPALSVPLDPGAVARLLVVCDVDSFCTADGDTLSVRLEDVGAIYLDSPQAVVGSFPMTTPAVHRVDGLVSHQIRVFASSDSTLITDPTNHLVFEFALDGNGYGGDTLTTLTMHNLGTADNGHIDRLALYRDGGDGVFGAGAGDDGYLGDFIDLGGKTYSQIGLAEPLPAGCGSYQRFFVGADLNPAPASGASIQFEIPVMGVEVASDDDGPLDAPVRDPSLQLIPKPDELIVFPYSVGDKAVLVGAGSVLNFGIGFYNGFLSPVVFDGVELFQGGSAVSSEIVRVTAHADADTNGLFDPAIDVPVATVTSSSPLYALGGLALTLTPNRVRYVFFAYDLSGSARDSVTVNLQVNGEADLTFASAPVVRGEFPLNSPGVDRTNGMTAKQLELNPAPSVNLPPADVNVFVLGFTLPANGFLADVLGFVTLRNVGTAVAGQDVSAVNLWAEDGGDGVFDAATDRLLATLNWTGNGWRNPLPLDELVLASGERCYVTVDLAATAADGRTIQMAVPVNGVHMESGNDGPIDAPVVNPGVQTISTDPLLSNVSADRNSYSVGQSIVVTTNVRNVGDIPLVGVHPSAPLVTGTGAATLQVGPVPASADLAPDQDVTFTWTLVATAAGDVAFCGNAFNADSTESSSVGCASPVTIQNRPLSVSIGLADVAPAGVDRGQQTVQAFRLSIAYSGFDSLSAPARVDQIALSTLDGAGSALPPNAVLSSVTFISTTGSNFAYTLTDSASNPVDLVLNAPIVLAPGDSVRLDVAFDVSPVAALQPFRLSVAAKGDIGVHDDNDGGAVPLSSTQVFPWRTNAIDVADPADSLRVATTDTSDVTVNVGQDDIALWRGTMVNPGSLNAADEILTGLTFDFFDTTGAPIAPSAVLREVSIHAGGTTLYFTEAIPTAGNQMACPLDNGLLLPAQVPQTLEVRVGVKSFPAGAGFVATLAGPSSVQARDIYSGQSVVVAPLTPGATFPMPSRTIRFEQPATGLLARRTSLAPPTLLPAQNGVPIIRIALSHADQSGARVGLDSLAAELTDPTGAPLFPADYFSRIRVMHGPDTLAVVTALSGVSPIIECGFDAPISIAAGSSDSITVLVDTKSSFSPAVFELRVEREGIQAYDENDGSRGVGISGSFPLVSEPAWLRSPGSTVACRLNSTLPANVSGGETGIAAFDFDIDNPSALGFTSAEMRRLSLRIEDGRGKLIVPSQLVASASLVWADSVIATGVPGPSDITFTISPGEVVVAPTETLRLRFVFDLAAAVSEWTFRFVLTDQAATDFVDASTGAPVTESGYPLATALCHVLSASESGGFTNYPNPFAAGRESTRITYYLGEPSRVTLRLYTLWGAPVATMLADASRGAGLHQDVAWSGRNGDGDIVNNGVYYLVLEIRPQSGGERTISRKLAVVR